MVGFLELELRLGSLFSLSVSLSFRERAGVRAR
jgi:hypothetical protein